MISVLKVDSKIVTIRGFEGGIMKMCAIEYPNDSRSEHQVRISVRYDGKREQMAFHFRRGKDFYYPAVVDKSLTLIMAGGEINKETIPKNGWFETRDHVADNYSLQSVADPDIYLKVEKRKPYEFTVGDRPEDSVLFTTERISEVFDVDGRMARPFITLDILPVFTESFVPFIETHVQTSVNNQTSSHTP